VKVVNGLIRISSRILQIQMPLARTVDGASFLSVLVYVTILSVKSSFVL
jgi:hypothetical protein